MRTYELVCIFYSNADKMKQGMEDVKGVLQEFNLTISREEDMRDRELTYPIKKETRGHYYLYVVEADPQKLQEVEQQLKLLNTLLKYLFVRKDD